MSTILFIRHGQASFGSENYDELSPLGIEQSRCLGRHFAQFDDPIDAVYSGPCRRQRDTARHLIDAAKGEGRSLPDCRALPGMNEYPAFDILKRCVPLLLRTDPEFQSLFSPNAPLANDRHFNRAYNYVMALWVRGRLDLGPLESYVDFVSRVRASLETLQRDEGRGRRIAVVTSGGPISMILKLALELTDEMAMRMGAVVANSSLTDLKYDEGRMTLTAFNRVPHLNRKALVTYR